MDSLRHDVRFALRGLARSPGFTTLVVLTLALGIGATTGVFSAVHGVLLASMPYPDADRMVFGVATFKGQTTGLSGPDCLDYCEQATSFTSLGAHLQFPFSLPVGGGDRPENVRTAFVSKGLFETLGVTPALGRSFSTDEVKPAPVPEPGQPTPMPSVVIVSHAFWQRRLGGSPDAVGSAITLAGLPTTVVGVMPEGFRFLFDADLWLPLRLNGPFATLRRFHNWFLVGKMNPGVTLAQAQGEMDAIASRLEKLHPEYDAGMGIRLNDLHSSLVAQVRPALLLLMAAVGLMLLIACGNVASLMLARGVTRRSELAMRVALGASRGRIVRQLVTESLLLALLGGALGLGVAAALQRLLPTLLNLANARLTVAAFRLDPRVMAFAFVVALLTGVAVGLVPALRSTARAPFEELKGGNRTLSSGGGARARLALVGVQVALSLVLLLSSALLVRSFLKLVRVELGFDDDNLVVSSLALPGSAGGEEANQFFGSVVEQVRAIPGVTGAAIVNRLPIREPGGSIEAWTPEQPELRSFSRQALAREVLPGYFSAMRMTLLAGRDLEETDRDGSPPVTVISEAMARMLFGGGNPVGRTVMVDIGAAQPTSLEVVGLVADARLNRLESEPAPVMYLSFRQYSTTAMRLVIRSTADPQTVATALRDIVARARPDVPVDDLASMKGIVADSTVAQRSLATIVTFFSLSALLLAGVGLFGVLAYQVDQRRHEIGLRRALGALRRHVLVTVLRQGLVVTGIGLVAGVVASLALSRVMAGMLFAVAPNDPASFASAIVALVAVAVVACVLPVIRALRVEPMTALRCE